MLKLYTNSGFHELFLKQYCAVTILCFIDKAILFIFSKTEKPTKGHKKSLESLKEKDPEFYEFLQQEDQDLLTFSGSDEGKVISIIFVNLVISSISED